MNYIKLSKYIALAILVLPMFYGYLKLLPGFTKYVLDALIILYIVLHRDRIFSVNPFTKLYVFYLVIMSVITILTLIIHGEGIILFIEDFQRMLMPLLLYLILKHLFDNDELASIRFHKLLLVVLLLQIPATIFQTLFFGLIKRLGLFANPDSLSLMDVARGTLGAGGHTYLGVLIPMALIYFYDLKSMKYFIPLLIPMILINSGGGIVLLALVVVGLVLHSLQSGSVKYRFRVIGGFVTVLMALFVFSKTEFFKHNVDKYVQSFLFYNQVYIQGGKETFGKDEHKLDRFNGYKFLERNMDQFDYEPLFGLGYEFGENGERKPYGYKNDLNTFIAEKGYLGLTTHCVFLVVFLIVYYRRFGRLEGSRTIKMLFLITFILSGLYAQSARSMQVWYVVLYVLVLWEHPAQYKNLLLHLQQSNPFKKIKKSRSMISDQGTVPGNYQ